MCGKPEAVGKSRSSCLYVLIAAGTLVDVSFAFTTIQSVSAINRSRCERTDVATCASIPALYAASLSAAVVKLPSTSL